MKHVRTFENFLNESASMYWPIDSFLRKLPGVKTYLALVERQISQMSTNDREEFVKKLIEEKKKKNIDSWTTAMVGAVSSYLVFPAFVPPILVLYFAVTLLRDFKTDEVVSYNEKLKELEEKLKDEIQNEKNHS